MPALTSAVSGSFTGTGTSQAFTRRGGFSLSLSGFGTGSIRLERSFDEGSTWLSVQTFTADAQKRVDEPSENVWYRLNCFAFTAGPLVYYMG